MKSSVKFIEKLCNNNLDSMTRDCVLFDANSGPFLSLKRIKFRPPGAKYYSVLLYNNCIMLFVLLRLYIRPPISSTHRLGLYFTNQTPIWLNTIPTSAPKSPAVVQMSGW